MDTKQCQHRLPPDSCSQCALSLVGLSDGTIRVEGARRGLWSGDGMWNQTMENICKERDEWRRRAEGAEHALEAYRQAETRVIRTATRFHGGARARFDVEFGGCAICGAPDGAKCTPECDDESVADAQVRPWSESGPGLSALPRVTDGHWVDPYDLLADDA